MFVDYVCKIKHFLFRKRLQIKVFYANILFVTGENEFKQRGRSYITDSLL